MSSRFDSRYLIVLSAFLIQMVMVGCMFAYGVFFTALEADLGWSRTTLSATYSISFLVIGVLGILAGRFSDRFGPRWVLRIAGVLFGLGYALMYFVSSPWQMYLFYGLLVGAGISAHDVVLLSTVARWFDKRRGIMICLMTLSIALLVLLCVESPFGLYLFAAIYGVSHGGLLTVVAPLIAEYFGTLAHGQIFGVVLFFGTLGGALGPLLAGMAFDHSGSYQTMFIAMTVLAGLGLVLATTLKPLGHSQTSQQR